MVHWLGELEEVGKWSELPEELCDIFYVSCDS